MSPPLLAAGKGGGLNATEEGSGGNSGDGGGGCVRSSGFVFIFFEKKPVSPVAFAKIFRVDLSGCDARHSTTLALLLLLMMMMMVMMLMMMVQGSENQPNKHAL
jgi:hypothetical protein